MGKQDGFNRIEQRAVVVLGVVHSAGIWVKGCLDFNFQYQGCLLSLLLQQRGENLIVIGSTG